MLNCGDDYSSEQSFHRIMKKCVFYDQTTMRSMTKPRWNKYESTVDIDVDVLMSFDQTMGFSSGMEQSFSNIPFRIITRDKLHVI